MGENYMSENCGEWCKDATKSVRRMKQCLVYNTTGLIAHACAFCGDTPNVMHDNEDWWVQCSWCGNCNYLTDMAEFEFPRNAVVNAWNEANKLQAEEEHVSEYVSPSMYVGEGEDLVVVNLHIDDCSVCGCHPKVWYRGGYWVACSNCGNQEPDEAHEDSVYPAAKYAIKAWNGSNTKEA